MNPTHLYYRDGVTRNDYAYPQPCWKRIPVDSVTAKHVFISYGGAMHKLTSRGLKSGSLYSASARQTFYIEPDRREYEEVWGYTDADGWVLDGAASAEKWYAKRDADERNPKWLKAQIGWARLHFQERRSAGYWRSWIGQQHAEQLQADIDRYEALLAKHAEHQGAAA